MSSAKITLIGFENYLNAENDSLFKYLTVPVDTIDKDTLIDAILLRGAEFEVLYSDPYFMQRMIGIWSNKWQRTIERWYTALHQEYSPIENYDRYEEWTENSKGTSKDSSSGTGSATSENKRSAFDSSVYENESQNISSTTNSTTGKTELDNENKHTGHLHGNIGVTTAAQMIQGELNIYSSNVYDLVADVFLAEFVLAVY